MGVKVLLVHSLILSFCPRTPPLKYAGVSVVEASEKMNLAYITRRKYYGHTTRAEGHVAVADFPLKT